MDHSLMGNLPREVIRQILTNLLGDHSRVEVTTSRQTRDWAFTNCLRVCREWYEEGASLLWTDLVILGTLQKFLEAPAPRQLLEKVSSLTLYIPECNDMSTFVYYGISTFDEDFGLDAMSDVRVYASHTTQFIWEALDSFPPMLRRMVNLTSFSFVVLCPHSINKMSPGFWLRPGPIRSMLDALQNLPKLEDLEIDTKWAVRCTREEKAICLCSSIAKLLPQLHNLRLCLSRFCRKLIASSSPSLESLVLNVANPYTSLAFEHCDHEDLPPESIVGHVNSHPATYNTWIATFISEAVEISTKGLNCRLPRLKECIVVEQCPEIMFGYGTDGGLCDAIVKSNILEKQVTAFPNWELPELSSFILPDRPEDFFLRVNDQDEVQDILGSFQDLSRHVEGHAWIQNSAGARFPRSRQHSCRGRTMTWQPFIPLVINYHIDHRDIRTPYDFIFMLERHFGTLVRPASEELVPMVPAPQVRYEHTGLTASALSRLMADHQTVCRLCHRLRHTWDNYVITEL